MCDTSTSGHVINTWSHICSKVSHIKEKVTKWSQFTVQKKSSIVEERTPVGNLVSH